MRVVVFGTGAVGGYFGGRLAEAGEAVTFVARGEHLAALRERGLRVSSVDGDFTIHPVRATDDVATIGPVDVVLVGVKAWQVADAARALEPVIAPDTVVVPLQNGVEAPSLLAAALGREHVLGGLCRIFAHVVAPGEIRHEGVEPYVAFGALDGSRSAVAERLREAFGRTRGVRAEILTDIQVAMWSKFLFIASVGGLGAVTRVPIGMVRSQAETRRMLEQAMGEVESVARASGVRLPDDAVATAMAFVDGLPPETTASMQRDIVDGRPSELSSQNGAVVRLARQAGVDVPVHRFIYHALLPLERKARNEPHHGL